MTRMETISWRKAAHAAVVPGLLAGAAVSAVAALRGRTDSGSAIAPLNATSHVLWGERASAVERFTVRHTVLGVAINTASALMWALGFQKIFGRAIARNGAPAALLGGAATAGVAYATDYHVMPRRLTPGWEHRVSARSMGYIFAAFALGLAGAALLGRRRRS